jgi:type IV pilus assembly protein PilM
VAFGSGGIVTGLDVGATSVKAATLRHRGGGVKLIGLAIADVAESDDRAGATVEAIKAVLGRSGLVKNSPIISVVGGASVSVKHVTFPDMPRQALAESIRWEARKHVPFGGSDFVLDFHSLEGADGDSSGELQVLLAAVETKLLDSHIETLKAAGIEPDAVDLAPLALMNEIDEEGLLNGDAVAAIDLGVSGINVSIYRRKGLFFARSIPLVARGPRSATSERGGDAAGDETRSSDELEKNGNAWKKTVLREVRRSLTFYNNETGKQGIDKIYLTGGRALDAGMDEMLQSDLGIATEVLNPLNSLSNVSVNVEELRSEGPRFAIALGLARRS